MLEALKRAYDKAYELVKSIKISIKDACKNPSSLYWADKSLHVSTYTLDTEQLIEQQTDFIWLSSLKPDTVGVLSQPILASPVVGLSSQKVTLSFRTPSAIGVNGYILLNFPCRFKTTSKTFWYVNNNFTI